MRHIIVLSCLFAFVCLSVADVSITLSYYASSCDDVPTKTFGPQTIPLIANCSAVPLSSLSLCGWDSCCDAPQGTKVKAHCEEVSTTTTNSLDSLLSSLPSFGGASCDQLKTLSKTLCNQAAVCVDSNPSLTCCAALKAWDILGCNTASIRPSGIVGSVCSYRPSSAAQYFSEKCQATFPVSVSTCDVAAPALDNFCGPVDACDSSFSPSEMCCTGVELMSQYTQFSSCALSGCNTLTVSYLKSQCSSASTPTSTPVPTSSPVLTGTWTLCQIQAANVRPALGAPTVRCEEDGSYSPMQCSGSTGHCWCVDERGTVIPNTTRGPGVSRPNCTRQMPPTPSPSAEPSNFIAPTSDCIELPLAEKDESSPVNKSTIAGATIAGVGCAAIAGALVLRRKRRTQRVNATLSHIQPAIPIKTVETIDIPTV